MKLEEIYKNISLTKFLETLDLKKFTWIMKRLSGNDTGLTGAHQVGIYVPKFFVDTLIPEISRTDRLNPDKFFDCYIASHDCLKTQVRVIYYNNKFLEHNGTRNEFRITRWAGTPIQDTDNTGSILILAVLRENHNLISLSWVSKNIEEENLIEDWLGIEVEPAEMYSSISKNTVNNMQLPPIWFSKFPTGKDIFSFVESKFPQNKWKKTLDELLLKRRSLEFEVFTEIEKHNVLPNIEKGFTSVNDFIRYSNSIANRRKSRAGTSLELNLESIFKYENLKFESQAVTELNKKPDFLFPSKKDYINPKYPDLKLHMLASKTCCKDRWRQVINEADRIKIKHLFTLQEGVSSNQLDEMYHNGIILVVPSPIMKSFPKNYHKKLMNLNSFVNFIKNSQKKT